MSESRDTFIFYRSFFEAIQDMPDADIATFIKAVCEYSLDFSEPNPTGVGGVAFKLVKPVLLKNRVNYENGSKAKRKRIVSETEAKDKPPISETEAYKDKDKDKDVDNNKNIKDSKFNFLHALINAGTSKEIAEAWLLVRKKKKLTNSEIAFNAIAREVEKSKLPFNDCIRIAVEKSWGGIEAEWIKNINVHSLKDDRSMVTSNGTIYTPFTPKEQDKW